VVFAAAISGFGGMFLFNGFVMVGFAVGSTADPVPAESLVVALDFLSRGHKYATKAITMKEFLSQGRLRSQFGRTCSDRLNLSSSLHQYSETKRSLSLIFQFIFRQITPMLHGILLITCMPHNFYTIYSHAAPLLEPIQNLNPDTLLALSVLS
jgi:hypothetical protein